MRTKLLPAILLASALSLSSCEWLNFTAKPGNTANLEGNWHLDSVSGPKDSTGMLPLLIAMAAVDSNDKFSLQMQFKIDSVFITFANGEKDTARFHTDYPASRLTFRDRHDTTTAYFKVENKNLLLRFEDSTSLHLRKQ